MEKIASFILSTGFIVAFCFLTIGKIYSQTGEGEHKSDSSTAMTKSGGDSSYTYVKGITAMRARSLAGVALGLTSLVIGWRALRRAAGAGSKGRSGAKVALSLGAIAIVISIIHIYFTAGAVFGSGSGKAGAIFALLLGFIGITLGGLAIRTKKRENHMV